MKDLLDSDELLHLAVIDSRDGRHDAAIAKLKQALINEPSHARAQFMLAAEHAEIGLFDRAIEGMLKAVELMPTLSVAHLQLGLIHFTMGNVEKARTAWLPLDHSGADDPMRLFKEGLLQLSESNPGEALRLLKSSLPAATGNPALARDISRVIANIESQVGAKADPGTADPGHLFAHKYDDMSRGGNGGDG